MSDRIPIPIPPSTTITAEMKRNLFLDLIAESRGELVEDDWGADGWFTFPAKFDLSSIPYIP